MKNIKYSGFNIMYKRKDKSTIQRFIEKNAHVMAKKEYYDIPNKKKWTTFDIAELGKRIITPRTIYLLQPTARELKAEWKLTILKNHIHMVCRDQVPNVVNILDYGGGAGIYGKIISRLMPCESQHFLAEVNDYNKRVMTVTKNNYLKINPLINKIPSENEKFHIILMGMVLHHVYKLDTVLKETVRVLAPGGLIWIYEHDPPDADTEEYLNLIHEYYMMFSFKTEHSTADAYQRIKDKSISQIMKELSKVRDDIYYVRRATVDKKLQKLGLKLIAQNIPDNVPNPQAVYMQIWQKPKNA